MKIIDSITEWAKKSPTAAFIALIVGIPASIHGLITASMGIYSSFVSFFEEDSVIAIIERGDFQHPEYDRVTVSFRNPTRDTKTVANISVICETHSGLFSHIPTINNFPQKVHPLKNITAAPFFIGPGEPIQVELVVMKQAGLLEINQNCKRIRTAWTNTQFTQEFGDFADIFKGEAMFSQTIINRELMND